MYVRKHIIYSMKNQMFLYISMHSYHRYIHYNLLIRSNFHLQQRIVHFLWHLVLILISHNQYISLFMSFIFLKRFFKCHPIGQTDHFIMPIWFKFTILHFHSGIIPNSQGQIHSLRLVFTNSMFLTIR